MYIYFILKKIICFRKNKMEQIHNIKKKKKKKKIIF